MEQYNNFDMLLLIIISNHLLSDMEQRLEVLFHSFEVTAAININSCQETELSKHIYYGGLICWQARWYKTSSPFLSISSVQIFETMFSYVKYLDDRDEVSPEYVDDHGLKQLLCYIIQQLHLLVQYFRFVD